MFQSLNYKLQIRLSDVQPIHQKSLKVTQQVFLAFGGLHEDKLCDTLQVMGPTNVKTLHQTFLPRTEKRPAFSATKRTNHAPISFGNHFGAVR